MGAYHSTYGNAGLFGVGSDTLVGFDVFRVEDGEVKEHWDNLQGLPPTPNPSGRTMTDGATKVMDLKKTEENRETVLGFVDAVFTNGFATGESELLMSIPASSSSEGG